MKKIFLILATLTIIPTYATQMCALNNTVAVVLDPTISGTNSGSDYTLSTWWAQFPYGRIEGISACIDTNWGKSRGGTVSKLTDSKGNRVYGGEKNGFYCWCKMTHPVSSFWTMTSNEYWPERCFSVCTGETCTSFVQNDEALRAGLFSSVQ